MIYPLDILVADAAVVAVIVMRRRALALACRRLQPIAGGSVGAGTRLAASSMISSNARSFVLI